MRPQPCDITPDEHTAPSPADTLECGHCAGYIRAGMFVDYCAAHGWLCEDCGYDVAVAAAR